MRGKSITRTLTDLCVQPQDTLLHARDSLSTGDEVLLRDHCQTANLNKQKQDTYELFLVLSIGVVDLPLLVRHPPMLCF